MNTQTKPTFAGFTYPKFLVDLPRKPISERLAQFKNNRGDCWHLGMSGYRANAPIMAEHNSIMFYLDSDLAPKLRWTFCDKIEGARINHRGWCTDEFGDGEKIRGIVLRLPGKRGFIPGWTMGEGMVSVADYDIYDIDSEIDCARAADRMAECAAELERESDIEYRRQQELEDSESE